VLLSVLLCDPLWFNELDFTTKVHKGLHKDFYDKTKRSLKIFSD
jgi:hypothetical protein